MQHFNALYVCMHAGSVGHSSLDLYMHSMERFKNSHMNTNYTKSAGESVMGMLLVS